MYLIRYKIYLWTEIKNDCKYLIIGHFDVELMNNCGQLDIRINIRRNSETDRKRLNKLSLN